MNIRAVKIIVLLVGILLVAAYAADVTGKWVAQVQGRNGQVRETVFNFKVEGDKLTGTVSGRGGETPISDGKISGDEISFTVVRVFRGNEFRTLHKGKVVGDEIRFTIEGPRGRTGTEFVAKRVK